MKTSQPMQVDAGDLELAFDFVRSGPQYQNHAYISLETGRIYWSSPLMDVEEEPLPDDIEDASAYIAVPHKNDLGVGRELVFDFITQHLPDAYEAVAGFFRQRGAYRQFKQFLVRRKMLERWFQFEDKATEAALRAWCEEVGLLLTAKEPQGNDSRA